MTDKNQEIKVKMTDADIRKHLISSSLLMVTSALGPAFLTQTATFTEQYGSNFSFAIILSLILSLGAQINVWRVLTVSDMYAQDFANQVFKGLGYVLSFFIFLGGLAFNIGNVSGAGLGLNAIFGLDVKWGAVITALIAIILFLSKSGTRLVDKFITFLAVVLLIASLYVAFISDVPLGEVAVKTFAPDNPGELFFPMITLVGGTVGGYITFAGAHRLIDHRIVGEENLKFTSTSATAAIVGSGIMRYLLFFVFLGVVTAGYTLDPSNPAVSAFQHALGRPGEILFGIILFSAALSSVIGSAYTSASFIRTFHPWLDRNNNLVIVGFITVSTLIFLFVGQPVTLLILAGSLNGLILPLSLGSILAGAHNKKLVGDYKHPKWMTVYGVLAVLASLYIGIQSLGGLAELFS